MLRLMALLTLALATPAAAQVSECRPPCRDGFTCLDGTCVSACNPACPSGSRCTNTGTCVAEVPSASNAPKAPASSADGAPDEERIKGTNLHVNALGLLQFGLIPRVEFGDNLTGLIGIHLPNTGALTYVLASADDEDYGFGFGVNLGMRYYFNSWDEQRGFYLGGFAEYAYSTSEDTVDDLAEYETHALITSGEVGFRWVFGSFLLDVGGMLGGFFPISSSGTPIGPGGCPFEDSCDGSDTTVFGMLVLDVGFFL